MRYKITFNPKRGQWVIQLLQYSLFWQSICDLQGDTLYFENLKEARKYAVDIGITEGYGRHLSLDERLPQPAPEITLPSNAELLTKLDVSQLKHSAVVSN